MLAFIPKTKARVSAGDGARRDGDDRAGRYGLGADLAGASLLDEEGNRRESLRQLYHQPHRQRHVSVRTIIPCTLGWLSDIIALLDHPEATAAAGHLRVSVC